MHNLFILAGILISMLPCQFYAHRGGRSENDENTIQAFRQCIDAGIDRFETDVRMTADGMIVISHDANLKRRTGFDGIVEQMKGKDVISKRTFLGNRIPSLAQVLRLFRKKAVSYVEWEMKTGEYPDEVIPVFCETLYKQVDASMPDGVLWVYTSFDERPLKYIREHFPEAKTGYITGKPVSEETIAKSLELKVNQIDAGIRGTTAEAVKKARESGLKVCLWPGDSVSDYYKMAKLGADRACTDYPNLVKLETSK